MKTSMPRRRFLRTSTLTGCGLLLLDSTKSIRGAPANDKLNLAIIGVGGRGRWFVDTMPKLANVVAMCDVNEQRAGNAFEIIPKARKFHDFRRMLEEMEKEVDGVIIATPDHTHAVAAAMALRLGKHVYCEKPLTHSIFEARYLRELAAGKRVATQMGNQGTASDAFRRAVGWIQSGVIGEVREVHAWNDSGGAGERPKPKGPQAIPDYLKWDLWLGPAPERDFHNDWLKWHTWRDFATGQLGNWAVHTMNLAFKALKLDSLWHTAGNTVKVRAEVSGRHQDTFPKWEIVKSDFPARGNMPPVRINWHNGRSSPAARQQLEDLLGRKLDWGDAGEKKWKDHAGIIVVGSKGKIHGNGHNTVVTLLPEGQFKDFQAPEPVLPRSRGHEAEWLDACKGGPAALSNFEYGGPLTEFVQLGNIATRVDEGLEYDPSAGKFAGATQANEYLKREYRKGWSL